MKISPENLIVDEGLCLNYKSFFITGNDEGYIFSLMDLLVKSFINNGFIKKTLVEGNNDFDDLLRLENKYVYVCEKYIGNNSLEDIERNQDILIFYQKTSPKNKIIKQFFSNSKERVLLECYELDQGRKKNILNGFIKKYNLFFEKNTYWFLLSVLDNRFAILNKELEKILLLENKNDTVGLANVLNMERLAEANKFFFKIHLGGDRKSVV